ncbi:MAG: D-glycero-alpha-D-manno-heptose-7-phosphate kinase [Actinomycetota bacterium]|nr:D-glycero-alpha-D-manno-heptose-7-phosphate kinase [Actinomycetota bacterium]
MRVIEASVPVRICDNGGWTDTWFGGPGRVLNIAVTPGVEVSIRATAGPIPVVLDVENFGDRYSVVPGESRVARHPLLEAAIDVLPPPGDLAVEVSVRSAVPAGCGAGTSAAVAVALLGALGAVRAEHPSPREVAYAAHRLEVDVLGVESGIQDQLSAAFGGINYLEIDPYPEATVHTLPSWEELSARLTLVFLGRAHDSSGLHRQVIENVARHGSGVFSRLRDAAVAARVAVLAHDLDAFGQAMIANTEAQSSLHPELVGADARRVIEVAAAQGAVGWKVNGAGGDGGSVTILSVSQEAKFAIEPRVAALDTRYRVLPIQVSSVGLEVHGSL